MDEEKLKSIINDAFQQHMRDFYVERERHYRDHEFVTSVREMTETARATACSAVTKGGLVGLGMLILYGLGVWIRNLFVTVPGK